MKTSQVSCEILKSVTGSVSCVGFLVTRLIWFDMCFVFKAYVFCCFFLMFFVGLTEMFQTPDNKGGKTLAVTTAHNFTPTFTAMEMSDLHTPEESGMLFGKEDLCVHVR